MNNIKKTIGWADYSWNPITGCSPVSEGCEHCYARALVKRFPQIHGLTSCGMPWDPVESEPIPFSTPVFHVERIDQPLKLKKPSRIFVCSMSDLFNENINDNWFGHIWSCFWMSPQHTFIILTKRPERMSELVLYLNEREGKPKNVWLGVSVENQAWADKRIPVLLQIPAARRVVSVEPMLGAVNVGKWLPSLDWIIAGPETGARKRPCKNEWIDSLARQCADSGVAFYDKRNNYIRRSWPELLGEEGAR